MREPTVEVLLLHGVAAVQRNVRGHGIAGVAAVTEEHAAPEGLDPRQVARQVEVGEEVPHPGVSQQLVVEGLHQTLHIRSVRNVGHGCARCTTTRPSPVAVIDSGVPSKLMSRVTVIGVALPMGDLRGKRKSPGVSSVKGSV